MKGNMNTESEVHPISPYEVGQGGETASTPSTQRSLSVICANAASGAWLVSDRREMVKSVITHSLASHCKASNYVPSSPVSPGGSFAKGASSNSPGGIYHAVSPWRVVTSLMQKSCANAGVVVAPGKMGRNRTCTAGIAQNPGIIQTSSVLFSAADLDAVGGLVREDANADALAESQLPVPLADQSRTPT